MKRKPISKLCALISFIFIFINVNTFAQTQIIATTCDYAQITDYIEPTIPEDTVFIWCSNNPQEGSLTITDIGGCTVEWWKYNEASQLYDIYIGNTATISNLESGGYEAFVDCGGIIVCYKAWVFVNQTIADIDPIPAGCAPFTIYGVADAVEDFTVYDPPSSPFIIDANTEITVCLSTDNTYVTSLGFYLKAPGYTLSAPGDTGCVILLPPWQYSMFDCYNGFCPDFFCDGTFPCNPGKDFINFCVSTESTDSLCVCYESTPITGTWRSTGSWSPIYGLNAAEIGWCIQIYDCSVTGVGFLTHVSLIFTGVGDCGPATFTYDSGPMSLMINDMACDAASASIYCIPPATPQQYTITNAITSAVWSCDPAPWNPAWGATDYFLNPNPYIDPVPAVNTTFCLTVTDNYGCQEVSCAFFEYVVAATDYENDNLILQIFPNPYKNLVNIRYYLKKKTTVNIKIFDVSGKEVQTIVSSIQAKGEYAYTFNAKQIGLQSGTYFVKLKFNNTTYVKKILEVK